MKVLGIESSCDETAMAVVGSDKKLYAHTLASQISSHLKYGGVVPEVASRNHLDVMNHVYRTTMQEAGIAIDEIDAIAVTAGPGLIGGLLVGVMFAKGLALAAGKPLLAINHLEAHALTVRFCDDIPFPYLMLLVSGGHCQVLEVEGVGCYRLLGKTRDDAVGEAFDKVARMLGLEYPGGPKIEQLAKHGNAHAVTLPVPILKDTPCDFSFSGLKTAVKRYIGSRESLSQSDVADICASFQAVVAKVLCDRLKNAAGLLRFGGRDCRHLVIAGGVAANQYIKSCIEQELSDFKVVAPPIKLCTDNGVMIAWAGVERMQAGMVDGLDFEPVSRWPLENLAVR